MAIEMHACSLTCKGQYFIQNGDPNRPRPAPHELTPPRNRSIPDGRSGLFPRISIRIYVKHMQDGSAGAASLYLALNAPFRVSPNFFRPNIRPIQFRTARKIGNGSEPANWLQPDMATGHTWQLVSLAAGHSQATDKRQTTDHNLTDGHNLLTCYNLTTVHSLATGHKLATGPT